MAVLPISAIFLAFAVSLIALAVQMAPGADHAGWSSTQPPRTAPQEVRDNLVDDGRLFQFQSRSETLSGRLYYPVTLREEGDGDSAPIIILAQGLGLTQDCSLTNYVEAFRAAGFAALTFDYATFGASTGTPRHQVHPEHHIQDIMAAITTVRERASKLRVDATRLALWGLSLGGGHVLRVAAELEDPNSLRAVVSMVPQLSSGMESVIGTLLTSPVKSSMGLLKVTAAAIRWIVQWGWKGTSWYIPLTGEPGSSAIMQNPGDFEGYMSLVGETIESIAWRNAATAPSAVRLLVYRPLNKVQNIQIPALMITAENDTLCPAKAAHVAKELINRLDCKLVEFPGAGHFDLYDNELHEQALATTMDFLQKHVLHK